MAVADVYDALIAEHVYKPAYSHEQAAEIIRDGRGSHFDPDMVDAFLTLSEEFRRIAQQFADAEPARLAEVDRMAADLPMERIELTSREGRSEWLCPAPGASSAVSVPVQGGGRCAAPVQPQLGQQLHISIHIGVACHQQLVAVKDGIGPGHEAQRLHCFAHLLAPGRQAHARLGHGDAGAARWRAAWPRR